MLSILTKLRPDEGIEDAKLRHADALMVAVPALRSIQQHGGRVSAEKAANALAHIDTILHGEPWTPPTGLRELDAMDAALGEGRR